MPSLNERLQKQGLGVFNMATNRTFLYWSGLPIVVPFLQTGTNNTSSFIWGGLFPLNETEPKPAPRELFAELNQKNLVYYDWEITEARMTQYRPLWQLHYILRGALPISTSSSEAWIPAVAAKLHNTVTQATIENPHRLKVVRQSQTGFSALELVLLAHLMDPNDISSPAVSPASGPSAQPPRQRQSPTLLPAPAPK